MPIVECGCIDIHTHIVPTRFPKYMGKDADARWPEVVAASPCRHHVMMQGAIYRTVSRPAWDMQARLHDMRQKQVAAQVLSPMPELLSYWMSVEDAESMCAFLNDTIAEYVQTAPDRFFGLGAVPLQDPDRAVRVLERIVSEIGLGGVLVGTNVNGVPIGHPSFRRFFEACRDFDAAVLVHPLRPAGMDRLVGVPAYEQVVAFPGEVGLAAASMVTGGTLHSVEGLRVAFTHGGGSLPMLVPRMQQAWELMPTVREALPEAPRLSVRRMYYDDLVYDNDGIEVLVRMFGETQVMAGTDYPFLIMDKDPYARIEQTRLDACAKERLRYGNALRWLGQVEEHIE